MKKALSLLLMLCMLASTVAPTLVWAETPVSDFYYEINNGEVTITGYTGNGGDVVIPDTIDGYPVVGIGVSAFEGCYNLTSIKLPDGLTSIGDYAFYDCDNLTSIKLPDGLTSIGKSAFAYCGALTSIEFPDGLTSIGNVAFEGCYNLTSIKLPDSLTSIGNYAFYDCDSLGTIMIPAGVVSMGYRAFSNCNNLQAIYCEAEYMPEGWDYSWTNIAEDSIYWGYIANQEHPEFSVRRQDGGLIITGYTGNGGDVVIPDTIDGYPVVGIGERAFYDCYNLTSIKLPDSLTSIGDYAFESCYNLTSIELPDSLTSIGDCAFLCCECLTDIFIPAGVTNIGMYAFSYCNSINRILCEAEYQPGNWHWNWKSDCSATVFWGCIANQAHPDFVVGLQDGGIVIKGYIGEGGDMVIPDTIDGYPVVGIGSRAFASSALTSINIPDSVTEIGDEAFVYCGNLTDVTIPGSIKTIGYRVFADTGLTSIVIPEGVTTLGIGAFATCMSLKTVSLPSTLETMEEGVFMNCQALTSILIPASVTTMGNNMFYNCYELTDIYCEAETRPDGWDEWWDCSNAVIHWGYFLAEEYPEYIFSRQNGALVISSYVGEGGDVVIPSAVGGYSIVGIGEYAFANCYALTSVVIPDGVTFIGNGAFSNCYYLENITLPDSLIEIGEEAFSGCWFLESIVIPDGVTYIRYFTFVGCSSLESVKLPAGLIGIEQYAFSGCEALMSIAIPESVQYIGERAFEHCTAMTDIYCGAESRPAEWDILWRGNCKAKVHWGVCAHGQTETYAVSATCTTDGYQIIVCTDCGVEVARKVYPAVKHNYQNGICKTCGSSIIDTLGAELTVTSSVAVAGDTVTVDVIVDKNVGMTYLNLLLEYDKSALELVSIANGSLFDNFAQDICMVWATADNVTETGVLVTLVFAVKADAKVGDYAVTVRCIECCDETEQDVFVGVTSGVIEVVDVVYGDCNGDGTVNGKDITRLLRYLASVDPMTGVSEMEIGVGADCNADGVVNGKDVTRLLRYLASVDPVTGESSITLGK